MNPTLCLPLVAVALALPVTRTAAQESTPRRFAFFSGVSFERGEPRNGIGLQVGGTLGIGLTSRVGMQFDAALQTFGGTGGSVYYTPCPPPSAGSLACGPVRTSNAPLTVASVTANIRYAEQRAAGGAFYWLGGVGLYGVAESPTDGSYARPGWNVGGGFQLRRSLFLDVRYHELIRPKTTRSVVPVTFSVRF